MANPPAKRGAKKIVIIAGAVIAIAALCWRFPLFHVVSLKRTQEQQTAAFNAETFVRGFWEKKLLPATAGAAELKELLPALKADPAAARKRFGRSLGMSSTIALFVKGSGRVTAIGEDHVRVAIEGVAGTPEVRLATGLLFGNAVRDGTGLLDVSTYSDSQHFNDISTELNRIVETQIAPALRETAAVGKAIRFAGCLEVEEDAQPENLEIVPVKVEWP